MRPSVVSLSLWGCAGNVPPKANLGDLRGLAGGLTAGGAVMIDGEDFDGAKAYKDSKVRLRTVPALT